MALGCAADLRTLVPPRPSDYIERRATPRHDGDTPPVIATAAGPTIDAVLRQLMPAAQCNWAIGAGLMQREAAMR